MRLKRLLIPLIILFYFAAFIFRNAVTLDPDFGWHLQFGRVIIHTHTIPLDDLYSYTMPSYHFIDHEWGSDSVIASMYDGFGMWPLLVLFALIGVGTLYFLSLGVEGSWVGVLLFLAGGTIFEFMGVRPQAITWMLLALLMSILWRKKLWQKWRFGIPFLFLFWANLHGGFAVGIVALFLFFIGQTIEQRRFDKKDIWVLLLSLLATLCNPYGYHLWIEVTKSAIDPNLRWAIEEWYPAIYFDNIAFWTYVAISLALIIRYYRRFSMTTLGIYLLFFIAGMSSMRNIPLFVVVSLYPTAQGITYLYKEAGSHLYGKERFVIGYIGFFLVCLFLYLPQLGIFVYGTVMYGEGQDSYPNGAVTYLKNHLPTGNIFFPYGWGGWLIWQLPEKKVFIDGRMPSWRNPTAPKNQSTYAFGEYRQILQDQIPFSVEIKKYDIDTVLVSTNDMKNQDFIIAGIDISKIPLLKPFFTSNMNFISVLSQLKAMGWRQVYHDETAVIFEKQTQ